MEENCLNKLAGHELLFERDDTPPRTTVLMDIAANQYDTARRRLRTLYQATFGVTPLEWKFFECLASVRNAMTKHIWMVREPEDAAHLTEQESVLVNLFSGHGVVRDFFEADIEKLMNAGLLRRPRIDGTTRKRINYKPYYVLTPEAGDCIARRLVGSNIGDFGETVVHSLGARMAGEVLQHRAEQSTGQQVTVRYYDNLETRDNDDLDVMVYVQDEDGHGKDLWAVAEVKTGWANPSELENSLYKMGHVDGFQRSMWSPRKYWVFPTRDLANRMVEHARTRGWYEMDEVPENLPLRTKDTSGIRSTNERVADGEFLGKQFTPQSPMTGVLSYRAMYNDLKAIDPAMFDPPRLLD